MTYIDGPEEPQTEREASLVSNPDGLDALNSNKPHTAECPNWALAPDPDPPSPLDISQSRPSRGRERQRHNRRGKKGPNKSGNLWPEDDRNPQDVGHPPGYGKSENTEAGNRMKRSVLNNIEFQQLPSSIRHPIRIEGHIPPSSNRRSIQDSPGKVRHRNGANDLTRDLSSPQPLANTNFVESCSFPTDDYWRSIQPATQAHLDHRITEDMLRVNVPRPQPVLENDPMALDTYTSRLNRQLHTAMHSLSAENESCLASMNSSPSLHFGRELPIDVANQTSPFSQHRHQILRRDQTTRATNSPPKAPAHFGFRRDKTSSTWVTSSGSEAMNDRSGGNRWMDGPLMQQTYARIFNEGMTNDRAAQGQKPPFETLKTTSEAERSRDLIGDFMPAVVFATPTSMARTAHQDEKELRYTQPRMRPLMSRDVENGPQQGWVWGTGPELGAESVPRGAGRFEVREIPDRKKTSYGVKDFTLPPL